MGEIITLQSLYDEIWTEFVLNKPKFNHLNCQTLLSLIEKLANNMYETQQLFVNGKTIESQYIYEINYLSTEGIILYTDDRKIQFIHQSFFDYAYARTFIEKGNKITESLNAQHQGLFVRSRTRQVLAYLRESDTKAYIEELDKIIFGSYRFHLKLMLLNSLGFYPSPKEDEKEWVSTHLINNESLYRIFIESVYSIEWFRFLLNKIGLLQYFEKDDKEIISRIYTVCWRLIESSTMEIISFIDSIKDIPFENSQNLISRLLSNTPKDKIKLAIPIFVETYQKWDRFHLYHFLDNAISYNPMFVKEYLFRLFEENLKTLNKNSSDYIPGNYEGMHVFKELHHKYKEIAIPLFIEITRRISEFSKNLYIDENRNKDCIFDSMAYFLYSPFKGHSYNHQELYNLLLENFNIHYEIDFKTKTETTLPLLDSDLALMANLGVVSVIKNLDRLKSYAYKILTTIRFYNSTSEILEYNIKNLLKESYKLFKMDEQKEINSTILSIKPEWEKENLRKEKGVSQYGYTRIGYTSFGFICMIPDFERKKHTEINTFYKEGQRKWGNIENKEPQSVEVRVGDTILPQSAYDKMTKEQWKSSFREIISDDHFNWDTPTRTGHCRKFQESVKQNPEQHIDLIQEIVIDKSILPIYSIYGLQGLKEANFDPELTKSYFIKFINDRFYGQDYKDVSNREWLQYSVWLVEYFINKGIVDCNIIEFLKTIIINYPDEEMLNNDPVMDGINRVRGAAASKLVECYNFLEFENDIFSTLEVVAKNGAIHTRAAVLYKSAYLNNLNKERNLSLFFNLIHDYNPILLKIPLHNLHPLVYLIHVDFKELIPFFERAIKIQEASEPISHTLLLAWLNDYFESDRLLNAVLDNNRIAIRTVVKVSFDFLDNKKYQNKSMSILLRFLDEDDDELGQTYEFGMHKITKLRNRNEIINFIDKYTFSNIGRYRSHYYYELLISLAKDIPQEVIKWALAFHNHLKPDIQMRYLQNEPIQAILLAYNAIRDYNKKDESLENAMNAFDEMLKVPEYRNTASEMLNKIDAE